MPSTAAIPVMLAAALACSAAPTQEPRAAAPPRWAGAWIWKPSPARIETSLYGMKALPQPDDADTTLQFRRSFELTSAPKSAKLRITADSRYRLWINGEFVGRGPAPCDPFYQSYDSWSVAPRLRAGKNIIAVECYFYGEATGQWRRAQGDWFAGTKRPDAPAFAPGAGGLLLDLHAPGLTLGTDAEWKWREAVEWTRPAPRINPSLGFVEIYDAAKAQPKWREEDAADPSWSPAVVHSAGGRTEPPLDPYPTLEPRDVAPMIELPVPPKRIMFVGYVDDKPDTDPMLQMRGERVEIDADLSPAGGSGFTARPFTPPHKPGKSTSVLFDFGGVIVGHPFIGVARAPEGAVIDIAYGDSTWSDFRRVASSAPAVAAMVPDGAEGVAFDFVHGHKAMRVRTGSGPLRFEARERAGFRYLQITVRASGPVTFSGIGADEVRAALSERGEFECSDAVLNKIRATSVRTAAACALDTLVDCPTREQRQYLGDAYVQARAGRAIWGDERLARGALRQFYRFDRRDGLPQLAAPGDGDRIGVTIPEYSLLGILALNEQAGLTELRPTAARALDWFLRRRRPDGLVGETPGWRFIDWADVDRGGANATVNGLLIRALDAGVRWAREAGDAEHERTWSEARAAAAASFEKFYDASRGAYVDALHDDGSRSARLSVHANATAVLAGVAPKERWNSIAALLAASEKLAYYRSPILPQTPFDDAAQVAGASPFFQSFVSEALGDMGRVDLALGEMKRLYAEMLDSGDSTFWEHWTWSPGTSRCHGWSAWPAWYFARYVLGVQTGRGAKGKLAIVIEPNLGGLAWARGVVPTPAGPVFVDARIERGRLFVDAETPLGAHTTVRVEGREAVLPDGGKF